MNDLFYGRSLNVLLGTLLLIVACVYVRFIRRRGADAMVRVVAALIAVPTMGALVICQIHLFRVLTGVSSPLRSDTVFFATVVAEGIATLAVIFRGALKARDATS